MSTYAVTHSDGSLSIMRTTNDTIDPQEEIKKWGDAGSTVASVVQIDEYDIPNDRTFRAAWMHDGKNLKVDIGKARDIHRQNMRVARAPKLAALDVAYQRAHETDSDTSAIIARKQALRDVTADPAIDAAQTPDALKAVWPDVLVS